MYSSFIFYIIFFIYSRDIFIYFRYWRCAASIKVESVNGVFIIDFILMLNKKFIKSGQLPDYFPIRSYLIMATDIPVKPSPFPQSKYAIPWFFI